MAYDQEIIEKAFKVWRESRNIEATASLMALPSQTISGWVKRHNWRERVREEKNQLATQKDVERFAEEYGITAKSDIETLKSIKLVENRCIKALKEKIPEDTEGLYPCTFESAVKALEMCWKGRASLFGRSGSILGSGNTIQANKVDIIGELKAYANTPKVINKPIPEEEDY